MHKQSAYLILFVLFLVGVSTAVVYDWSVGVQNQVNYSEFTMSLYDPPGPPAVWAGDDNLWEEGQGGDFVSDKPFLMKKNSEYTSSVGALGLSLAVPNGDYEIVMSQVFMHGAQSEGGGFAEVEVIVEGNYLFDPFSNDGLGNTRDLELFTGPRKITVTDESLDLVVGQCRTTRVSQGRNHWFSFEGFKLTRVAAPDSQLPGNPGPTGTFVPDKTLQCELSWSPGDTTGGANGYQIYFGDTFDDVSNASTSDTTGIYRGSVSAEVSSYAIPETVWLGKTYYWRIDQVSNSATSKGYIWNFKVADYQVVDDTESYNQTKNISETWKDSPEGNSNSTVSLDTIKGRQGKQAIKLAYDNSGADNAPYYSEIKADVADLEISSDWSGAGLKTLDLWFRGTAGNAAEQMYLAVEDTAGHITTVPYDSQLNNLTQQRWHLWHIDLQQFSDVNLSSVARIYIGLGDRNNPVAGGSGTVYFDDIRLYIPRSINRPRTSLSDDGDCRINLADSASLTDQWCKSPSQFTEAELQRIRYLRTLFQSSVDRSYPIPLSYEMALSFEELGKYQQAKAVYQQIQQCPGHPFGGVLKLDIRRVDILLLIKAGQDDAAQGAIDSLFTEFTNRSDLPSEMFYPIADHYGESLFRIGNGYYYRAFKQKDDGLETKAEDSFTKAITVWQRNVQELPATEITSLVYYFTADCHYRLGQYQQAIENYQTVLANWPEHRYAWNAQFQIGRNYENLKKAGILTKSQADSKIKAAYEQVVEKYPTCKAARIAKRWLSR